MLRLEAIQVQLFARRKYPSFPTTPPEIGLRMFSSSDCRTGSMNLATIAERDPRAYLVDR